MSKDDDKTLDELLNDDADKRAKMRQFQDTDWSRLSPIDFAQQRSDVFREMRRVGKQRRLVSEVEQADAEAEAAKRRSKTVKLVDVRTE